MIDKDTAIAGHLNNLRKMSDVKNGNSSTYLTSIYDYDELKGYYVRTLSGLPYGLKVETKRQRLVMDKSEFESSVEKMITQSVIKNSNLIQSWASGEVMDIVEDETMYLLNSITYNEKTGFQCKRKPKNNNKSFAEKLGVMLGKAIANDVKHIWDDMTGTSKRKR